jgi:hypothetical protein
MEPVTDDFLSDLTQTLAAHGFRRVADVSGIPNATLLLKRQTWNTNRAVIVVSPRQSPGDIGTYLRQVRNRVARRCGFFPFFWGIGIQVVLVAPDVLQINASAHVARVDNQWAIIQSIFLVDPLSHTYDSTRTWGQFVTGKFQDAIASALSRHFVPAPVPS